MKSLYELQLEVHELRDKILVSNAYEYMLGLGEVTEKDIQDFHNKKIACLTAIRIRGLENLYDELEMSQLLMDYYNPGAHIVYYKECTPEIHEKVKESHKYWKSISNSLSEEIEEKSKNIFIEE